MPIDRMIIDPTTGGLGYGLEYSYSVMERLRMAALAQGDEKLQLPIINNLGNEVWKCKEAKQTVEEAPLLGDPEKRGILMEAVGAVAYLMSGSNVLIMRHPESIRMVKSYIDLISEGGMATDIAPVKKQLAEVELDLLSLSPDPDLTIAEEKAKKAAPAKKKTPPETKDAAKVISLPEKKAAAQPAPTPAPEPAAAAKVDEEAKAKAAEEDKLTAEADAQAKAEAKAEAEEKAKAAEEARIKAEDDAKLKAAEDAKAKAAEERAKIESELEAVRQKRAAERAKLAGKRADVAPEEVSKTPAAVQKSMVDKMIDNLAWIHKKA
jgi:acetyl-CoA decarbonylase/synthase complex subunit delta